MKARPELSVPREAEEVLDFWFGGPPGRRADPDSRMRRWFGGNAESDARIRERFGARMAAAAGRELDAWAASPRGRLALILLLDQFPRSAHRGEAAAFAQDDLALELALTGIEAGLDRALSPLERCFFYMPLQHAESLEVQRQSVGEFEALADDAEPSLRNALAGAADYARRHRDIIAEFGRFPHRNAALGRPSTSAEQRYLERGAPRFGQ